MRRCKLRSGVNWQGTSKQRGVKKNGPKTRAGCAVEFTQFERSCVEASWNVIVHIAETRFRLSAKRTSPFKSAGASVQSTTGGRGVRISGSNAGYTMLQGSVKGTGYPLHSPVSPSLPLPCVTACRHISTGLYHLPPFSTWLLSNQPSVRVVAPCLCLWSYLFVKSLPNFSLYFVIIAKKTQINWVKAHSCAKWNWTQVLNSPHLFMPSQCSAFGLKKKSEPREWKWVSGRVQLKCDGTRWRRGGEVNGKLANGVGSQYSSRYLGTCCIQHYYRWCAHLGCQ